MPNAKANGGSGGFRWTTDPTFYPTARSAMEAPAEKLAYVAALAPDQKASRPLVFYGLLAHEGSVFALRAVTPT